jgi:eukaryotic-like serine/threonine-protein kinase
MNMTTERWAEVKRIFQDALEQSVGTRNEHIALACGSDSQLRGEVERLLYQHDHGQTFLAGPALSAAASSWASASADQEGLLDRGAKVGDYTVQDVIGAGGMGIVYRAIHDDTNLAVALKVLRVGLGNREAVKRFRRETQLLARLEHPGIAKIIESGTSMDERGGRPFYAMELVEGVTATRYAEENDLSIRERLMLVVSIAEAVHHAHEHGIVHRDLKPPNIMVDASGQPKVLDFGVARRIDRDVLATTLRTEVGKLIGTIAYMSPEQVAGASDDLDTRSDIYALGVVAYELLTGRLPYDLSNKPIPEAIRIIGQDDPTPLSSINRVFRGEIETILSKALEKDRASRYQSALDFAKDIQRYLQYKPIVARRATALQQLRRFARQNRAFAATLVFAMLALMGAAAGTTWQGLKARAQLRTATDVNRFLHDLLESPSHDARGRDLTVLELFERVPDELEDRFPNRPEVRAPIYTAIGNTYQQVGLLDMAETYVRKGYADYLNAYGEEHDQTVNAMAWLVLLLERQGRLVEAESLGRRTLDAHSRMSGPEHVFPISAIANLANVLRQQGRFVEAEGMLRGLIAQHERTPKEHGTNLYYAEAILARVLIVTDRAVEAEGLAQLACGGFQRMFGDDDWRTLYALTTKARAWHALNRTDEAETLLRHVLDRHRQTVGSDHAETISALYDLASVLVAKSEFTEALALVDEALLRSSGVMKPEHWRVARIETLRATCERKSGQSVERAVDLAAPHDHPASALKVALPAIQADSVLMKSRDEN